MTIKESAEKKYSHLKHNQVVFEQMVRQHINEVTYYESLMRAEGYEMVKVVWSGDDAVSAEKSTLLRNNTCFYESDNTTAMNCKHCGKPKFYHNQ